jgi:hypothetical protein
VSFKWKTLLLAGLIGYGAWHHWQTRPLEWPPGAGQLAAADPVQGKVTATPDLRRPDYRLTALASYDITARVLSIEPYYLGRAAGISPLDLALGWGPMSDDAVLKDIRIRQSGRFYTWRTEKFPISSKLIETHSANTHVIPANPQVKSRITAIRSGEVVRLYGYLVEIRGDDGWRWRSSLSRGDTGSGACELMWVEQVETVKPQASPVQH